MEMETVLHQIYAFVKLDLLECNVNILYFAIISPLYQLLFVVEMEFVLAITHATAQKGTQEPTVRIIFVLTLYSPIILYVRRMEFVLVQIYVNVILDTMAAIVSISTVILLEMIIQKFALVLVNVFPQIIVTVPMDLFMTVLSRHVIQFLQHYLLFAIMEAV